MVADRILFQQEDHVTLPNTYLYEPPTYEVSSSKNETGLFSQQQQQ